MTYDEVLDNVRFPAEASISGRRSPWSVAVVTDRTDAIARSYDRMAEGYASQFFDELRHKPLDRALLAAFAEIVGPDAPVADIGCGPGQVARELQARGLRVIGIDLSRGMITTALELTPGIDFRVGSMLALELADGSLAGMTAFYAIVHLEPFQLATVFRELFRVLRPGGVALLSFHVGRERVKRDEMFGQPIELELVFFDRKVVETALENVGFAIEMRLERSPYVAVEHPSTRGYLLARKPA
jgi:SAM-dependent methyltransferase